MPDLSDLAAALRANPEDETLRDMFVDELMCLTACSRPAAGHVAHSIRDPARHEQRMWRTATLLNLSTDDAIQLRCWVWIKANVPRELKPRIIVVAGDSGPGYYPAGAPFNWDVHTAGHGAIGMRPLERITRPPWASPCVLVGANVLWELCASKRFILPDFAPPPHQNHDGE